MGLVTQPAVGQKDVNFSPIHWLQEEERSQASSLLTVIWHTELENSSKFQKGGVQQGQEGSVPILHLASSTAAFITVNTKQSVSWL